MAPPPDDTKLDWLREDLKGIDGKLDTVLVEERKHGVQIRKLFAENTKRAQEIEALKTQQKGHETKHESDPWIANQLSLTWAGRKRIVVLLLLLLSAAVPAYPFLLELIKVLK